VGIFGSLSLVLGDQFSFSVRKVTVENHVTAEQADLMSANQFNACLTN